MKKTMIILSLLLSSISISNARDIGRICLGDVNSSGECIPWSDSDSDTPSYENELYNFNPDMGVLPSDLSFYCGGDAYLVWRERHPNYFCEFFGTEFESTFRANEQLHFHKGTGLSFSGSLPDLIFYIEGNEPTTRCFTVARLSCQNSSKIGETFFKIAYNSHFCSSNTESMNNFVVENFIVDYPELTNHCGNDESNFRSNIVYSGESETVADKRVKELNARSLKLQSRFDNTPFEIAPIRDFNINSERLSQELIEIINEDLMIKALDY